MRGKMSDEAANVFKMISQSGRQMSRLIEGLLAFSRSSRTEMAFTEVDLGVLVEEARAELGAQTQGRDIEWVIPKLPTLRGDPITLRQVFINLLSNALKYTSTRAKARIEITVRDAGHETIIGIRDNGVGFEPQYTDRLFGVFQRLHPATQFEGTGIGLAIVRRIIARHGGQTWAEGERDKGAAFFFSLPKQPDAALAKV